ncbi:MAG: hypothetical protein KJ737_13195 [Proteobacteria bacterium]|nr:hypothetical protein [Pseudomonadota bacterium]
MAQEKDIVLIYLEDKPVSFARIEDIQADHKKNWYHVTLLMLQIPLQVVSWILKNNYIDGDEFTMQGNRMRLELVMCPPLSPTEPTEDDKKTDPSSQGKKGNVISFKNLKKE